MAEAFEAAGIDPRQRPEVYEQIIPEHVLILAVELDQIPKVQESDPAAVRVGRWFIDTIVKAGVLRVLASRLNLVRSHAAIVNEDEPLKKWQSKPNELIDNFLRVTGWRTIERLSIELSNDNPR